MADYAQFVTETAPYTHFNRMVEYLELYRMCRAGDGAHFDAQMAAMLDDANDEAYGGSARMIGRLEEQHGGKIDYRLSPAEHYPRSFEIACDLATMLGKEQFVEAALGPSGVQLPRDDRIGVTPPDASTVERLRQRWQRDFCIEMRGLFDLALLDELADQVERARFGLMLHGSLGTDTTMDFGPTQLLLHYLVTDARLLHLLEDIAGLPGETCRRFSGRVYRMVPGGDEYDVWHDDINRDERRLLAISVALARTPCRGGALRLRGQGRWRQLCQTRPMALGDLAMFRLSRHLQHKVGRIWRGQRTNFVGWLCPTESFDYDAWVDAPLFEKHRGPLGWLRTRLTPR